MTCWLWRRSSTTSINWKWERTVLISDAKSGRRLSALAIPIPYLAMDVSLWKARPIPTFHFREHWVKQRVILITCALQACNLYRVSHSSFSSYPSTCLCGYRLRRKSFPSYYLFPFLPKWWRPHCPKASPTLRPLKALLSLGRVGNHSLIKHWSICMEYVPKD